MQTHLNKHRGGLCLKNYLLFFLFEYYKLASMRCAGTMRIFGVTHA